MKTKCLLYVACALLCAEACSFGAKADKTSDVQQWNNYPVGNILFEDKAPQTKGSEIYHRIIPNAEDYIKEQAKTVLSTLYSSPQDSIPAVSNIHYTLEDIDGISAKGGDHDNVTIFYSTRHIEKSFEANDTTRLFLKHVAFYCMNLLMPFSLNRRV